MEASRPLHTDRQRASLFQMLGPGIAGFLVVLGLLQGNPLGAALGVVLGIYIWFTRHRRYEIFPDRLVVHFGNPRRKAVPLEQISAVRPVRMGLGGEGLLIQRSRGWPMVIRPSELQTFMQQLEQARGSGS